MGYSEMPKLSTMVSLQAVIFDYFLHLLFAYINNDIIKLHVWVNVRLIVGMIFWLVLAKYS